MIAAATLPGWLMGYFILQEAIVAVLFAIVAFRSYRRLRTLHNVLLKKLNWGITFLGIGVVLRSIAIFAPAPIWDKVVIWQIAALFMVGAWHFMFNHDFNELTDFLEMRDQTPSEILSGILPPTDSDDAT